jgi:hypothetical protein
MGVAQRFRRLAVIANGDGIGGHFSLGENNTNAHDYLSNAAAFLR